jgi:hypothetical protein
MVDKIKSPESEYFSSVKTDFENFADLLPDENGLIALSKESKSARYKSNN